MKNIEGIISDKNIEGKDYVYKVFGQLGFWYSSNIHNGTEVKLYMNKKPNFGQVYEYFMSCKFPGLKMNKLQDICLSLFYDPYFNEFYETLKCDILHIRSERLILLKHFMLEYLANPRYVSFNGNDIYTKSKELLEIINSL